MQWNFIRVVVLICPFANVDAAFSLHLPLSLSLCITIFFLVSRSNRDKLNYAYCKRRSLSQYQKYVCESKVANCVCRKNSAPFDPIVMISIYSTAPLWSRKNDEQMNWLRYLHCELLWQFSPNRSPPMINYLLSIFFRPHSFVNSLLIWFKCRCKPLNQTKTTSTTTTTVIKSIHLSVVRTVYKTNATDQSENLSETK